MNTAAQFENSVSRSRSQHEGESSTVLCDRPSRTRATSQRQLPTDQDYAVSTREYQTDQSSLKPAPAAAGPVLELVAVVHRFCFCFFILWKVFAFAFAFALVLLQAAIGCLTAASALTPMAQMKPSSSRPTAVMIFL